MENTQTLLIEDTKKIKSINFKFPNLMSSNAEGIIKRYYQSLLDLKDQLQDCRTKAWELEEKIKEAEKEFRDIASLCTIEFETYSKEYKTNSSGLYIKGQGNSILGNFGN